MYSTASKVKELDFYTRLSKAFKSDLCWWHTFLKDWNGISLFKLQIKTHQLMLQYKLMYQRYGAVVLCLIINGLNGSGQKSENQ